MIEAFKKRIFTKKTLLAFALACFAWTELSTSSVNLWDNIQFYQQSTPAEAQLVSTRQRTVEKPYEILSSGAIALQGDTLYRPVVSYPSTQQNMLLCVELPADSKTEYTKGQSVPIRILNSDHLIAKESHDIFLWAGDTLHIIFGLILIAAALYLLKRTQVVRSIAPTKSRRRRKS